MPKPKHHVFVCTNQRPEEHPRGSCVERGSMAVWQKFAEILDQKQMYQTIMVSGVRSCLGPCKSGPIVVVQPDNVWYRITAQSDIDEIFEDHLVNGKLVERLIIPDEMIGQ